MDSNTEQPERFVVVSPPRRRYRFGTIILLILGGLFVLGSLGLFMLSYASQPPVHFPIDTPIVIEEGWGVATIAAELKAQGVIRSELLFYLVFLAQFEPYELKASTYIFSEAYPVETIAKRLATGDFASNLVRLTHLEGDSVVKFAPRITAVMPDFDTNAFVALALPYEGQLFPDTYFVPNTFSPEELLSLLRTRYQEAIAPLESEIATHPLTEIEIITLASLLEREANSPETKQMVAGILQNRLAINMPLQVDASIEYDLDKPLSELTPEDLERPSPYNTYLNFGLPPTPIGNPGLAAIEAVLRPTPSEYYFYITGRDGQFYYAETFDEHRQNIVRYLR